MVVFRVAGGRFPLNLEPPQRKKKNVHLGKAFSRNQTFDIQIAMSIVLWLSWPKRRKNLPDGAAHTYIAHIRETPLPGGVIVRTLCILVP